MTVGRVKVFFSARHSDLGQAVTSWLDSQAGCVQVLDLTMDSNDYGHCLVVHYAEAQGPRYRVNVWFAGSHRSLEEAANDALGRLEPAKSALVAVGSNSQGHCLCLIENIG